MAQLKPLKGEHKPRPDYTKLYAAAFGRKAREFSRNQDRQNAKQLVFYGITFLNLAATDTATRDELGGWLLIAYDVKLLMESLTPAELMQIFPVIKAFDGAKRGGKDYFYTMRKLQEHGLNKPMGQAANEMLWDYINPHTLTFIITILSAADRLRQLDGEEKMYEGLITWQEYLH